MTLNSHMSESEAEQLAYNIVLDHLNDLKNVDDDKVLRAVWRRTVFGTEDLKTSELIDDVSNVSAEVDEIIRSTRTQLLRLRKEAVERAETTVPPPVSPLPPEPPSTYPVPANTPAPRASKVEGDVGTWSHCGSRTVHGPHRYDTAMNEGPYYDIQCNGTTVQQAMIK